MESCLVLFCLHNTTSSRNFYVSFLRAESNNNNKLKSVFQSKQNSCSNSFFHINLYIVSQVVIHWWLNKMYQLVDS